MPADVISNDLIVQGNLVPSKFTPPAQSITDQAVTAAAGIQASKLQQQYQPTIADNYTVTTATFRRSIHHVRGATATIQAFWAGNSTVCVGAATISIQVKKNGSNILTAALVLNNTNTNYVAVQSGAFTSTALVANDLLEVDVTATAGGGTLGLGFFCQLILREDAQ